MTSISKRTLSFKKDATTGNLLVNDGLNGFAICTSRPYSENDLNELLNKAYEMGYGQGHFDGYSSIPNKDKY